MAFTRQSGWHWKPTTLRNTATDEVIGSWKKKHVLSRKWVFRDANEAPQFVAARPWQFGRSSQTYRLESANGGEIGRFNLREKEGVIAYEAEITLEASSVPPEISLAVVCDIFRARRSPRDRT